MKEGKGFYKLNDESIAAVREDLAADYQALADHHSEEVIELLEEYDVADLEIARHLLRYDAKRKATGLKVIEIVELPDNPPEEPKSVLIGFDSLHFTRPQLSDPIMHKKTEIWQMEERTQYVNVENPTIVGKTTVAHRLQKTL